jgi:hypothetical protein
MLRSYCVLLDAFNLWLCGAVSVSYQCMIIQDYICLKVARMRDDLLVGTKMMDVVKEI